MSPNIPYRLLEYAIVGPCLSASEKYKQNALAPDLDVVVHVYDFRMSHEEIFLYIEEAVLSGRFDEFDNDLRNYALVVNGITYMQRNG